MHRLVSLLVVLMGAWACTKEPTAAPAQNEVTAVAPTAGVPAAPAAAVEQAYVTFVTGLRKEPTDAQKIDDAATGKKVGNWLTTLYRGEEVAILEVKGDWARVRASDDSEGWVQKNGLLPVEGVTVATVFEQAKTFSRPDLLALNATRVVEPGTLLFGLKTKDQFAEVNFYGQGSAWILAEKLNTDAREIAAAKLLAKVRWLKERKDTSADKVMELARTEFADSKLSGMADADATIHVPAAVPAVNAGTEPGTDTPAPAPTP